METGNTHRPNARKSSVLLSQLFTRPPNANFVAIHHLISSFASVVFGPLAFAAYCVLFFLGEQSQNVISYSVLANCSTDSFWFKSESNELYQYTAF